MGAQPAQTFLGSERRDTFSPTTRAAFEFDHSLGTSPLLGLDRLRDLVLYTRDRGLSHHFECAEGGPGSGWGSQPDRMTVLEAFDSLATGNALVLLKGVHRHPDYNSLMSAFLAELGDMLQTDMSRTFEAPICTIILASPKRITPYHMDDSHNFLMQIHGDKTFYVFDGSDPEVVSEQERHEFWSGNPNAAVLTDARQQKATAHALFQGRGVHVPLTYPHWALNGSDVSVAVSINFRPSHHRAYELYGMNRLLRRTGLKPQAPGSHPVVDDLKVAAFRALSAAKRIRDQTRHRSH